MKTMVLKNDEPVFSGLVGDAEKGEPTIVMKDGTPAAMIVPFEAGRRLFPTELPNLIDYLATFPGDLETRRDTQPLRRIDM